MTASRIDSKVTGVAVGVVVVVVAADVVACRAALSFWRCRRTLDAEAGQLGPGGAEALVARLREGFVLQDFLDVVSVMNKQWKGDEKMAPYIPPSTLYKSKEKFLEYKALAMAQLKKNPTTPSKWSDLDYSAF